MALKNHIHLQPIGELWTWSVLDYQTTPVFYVHTEQTQTNKLATYTHSYMGQPVITYIVDLLLVVKAEQSKTFEQRKNDLLSLIGYVFEFVPPEHEESPLSPIYSAKIAKDGIGAISFISPAQARAHVPVKLEIGSFA